MILNIELLHKLWHKWKDTVNNKFRKNLLYPKQIYGVMSIHNIAIIEYVLLFQCHVLYGISSKAENDFLKWFLMTSHYMRTMNKTPVNVEYNCN